MSAAWKKELLYRNLTDNKILDSWTLKTLAEEFIFKAVAESLNMAYMIGFIHDRLENIVGKGENA